MLWRRGVDKPVIANVVVKQWKEADVHTGSGQLCMESAWRRWMPREERTVAAQSVLVSLFSPCNCSVKKRRRGLDHGVVACCLHAFLECGLLELVIGLHYSGISCTN